MWLNFGVIWWRFDEEMKKKLEELWDCFSSPLASWNGVKRERVLIKMKLPREALMCGPKLSKSQLSLARARARFVLDSSRVCCTSALNL